MRPPLAAKKAQVTRSVMCSFMAGLGGLQVLQIDGKNPVCLDVRTGATNPDT